MNKPEFPTDTRHARRNLANFAKDQRGVPFTAYQKFVNRYQHDAGFQHTIDSAISFSLSLLAAVGIVVFVVYQYYSNYYK